MPMVDIALTEDSLTPEATNALAAKLSEALIAFEGAPDNQYVRSLTWCFIDRRPAGSIFVGGVPAPQPRYRITLTVPEFVSGIHGPVMFENRKKLVRHVTEMVLQAEGTEYSAHAATRVWVHIRELPEGFWGAFGEIAGMRDISTFASGQPRFGEATELGTRWRKEFVAPDKAKS
jgi:phenylpyruvate tautomerase PptA (4-oxalocrotonate tautomerase family)